MAVIAHQHLSDGETVRGPGRGGRVAPIYVTSAALILSAIVKVLQPAQAIAYMGSMGYEGGTYFLIAALEFTSALLFLVPATRRLGLVMVSAYFGGAIAAHLAIHPPVTIGPGLYYLTTHPFTAVLVPGTFLVAAWIGAWRDPRLFRGD